MIYRDSKTDELILRDLLALDRTRLANERTFLAYLRTAIMVGVSGVTFIKLFPHNRFAQTSGWALPPIAALLMLYAATRFLRLKRSLSTCSPQSGEERET